MRPSTRRAVVKKETLDKSYRYANEGIFTRRGQVPVRLLPLAALAAMLSRARRPCFISLDPISNAVRLTLSLLALGVGHKGRRGAKQRTGCPALTSLGRRVRRLELG